ncbi:MAG: GNAT family N-acetyltransferase [Boseongicola sp.]
MDDAMNQLQFDTQPHLTGPNLILSPLREEDYDGLHRAAGDPFIWAGHPAKDRHRDEVFRPYFGSLLHSGATLAIRDRASGAIIGCSRYYVAPGVEDDISIGFTFLRRDHWGGATNRELKTLMFDHAFNTFETVWFHIGPDNVRSQQATQKLGAEFSHEEVLDLSNGKNNVYCYRLERSVWQRRPTASPN